MSGTTVSATQMTPWQRATATTPARFAQESPALAAAGVAGPTVLAIQAARRSDTFRTVMQRGAVPVIGLAAATAGVALAHDAVVNDLGQNNGKAAAKLAGGAALTLGGTEAIGRGLGATRLQVVSNAARAIARNGVAIAAGSVSLAAAAGTAALVNNMRQNGVNLGNSLAATAAGTFSAGMAFNTVMEVAGVESRAANLAYKGIGLAAGAGLAATSYAFGKNAAAALRKGRNGAAAGHAAGALAAATGSSLAFGHATGFNAISAAGRLIARNPITSAAVAATAAGAVGYYLYTKGQE